VRFLIAAWIAASAVVVDIAPVPAQGRAPCDRTCLTGFIDRYIDALVARDLSRLLLAPGVKFTENGQRLPLGDGLWHTVTGKGGYRLEMADVDAGQAIAMGTIREADTRTIEKGLIGPVESVLYPVPYGMDSGWSTWEDAMSSRPRWQ
jgi:hypothetical protein